MDLRWISENEQSQSKKSGVILTYLTQTVKILTGLIYTPIMLSIVGQSEYGLYEISESIISYLVLINLGF